MSQKTKKMPKKVKILTHNRKTSVSRTVVKKAVAKGYKANSKAASFKVPFKIVTNK